MSVPADHDDDPWIAGVGGVGASQDLTPQRPAMIIKVIENVEPLDGQIGAFPKRTAPTKLHDSVFGQPEPTDFDISYYGSYEAVPEMGTFAVLDAAKVPLLPILLDSSGLTFRCIFQGKAEEELADAAPYLVELKDGEKFTRSLFTSSGQPGDLWDRSPGMIVRSRGSLTELRGHFRKFTRVRDESGRWFYFRFWEVSVIPRFLSMLRPDQLEKFRIIYGGMGNLSIYSTVMTRPQDRLSFILSAPHQRSASNRLPMHFRLTSGETECFRSAMWSDFTFRLRHDMKVRAKELYDMTEAEFSKYYDLVLKRCPHHFCGSERDFSAFVAISFDQGIEFWDSPRISALLSDKNLQRSGRGMDAVLYSIKKDRAS